MASTIRVWPQLVLATLLLIPQLAYSSGIIRYSSSLAALGGNQTLVSVRGGLGDTDDISGTFLDADNDMLADGFLLEAFNQGGLQGTQTHSFSVIDVDGVSLLGFPIVSSNNFPLTAASVLPLPAGALPLVPITSDARIVVSRQNGQSILSFPLMIDPELLSDALFGDGFELQQPPSR